MNPFSRVFALLACVWFPVCSTAADRSGRFLYVAEPGIRDYTEYGGHGILVYDIDHQHRLVKRIPTAGVSETGKPLNVKGIAASIPLQRVFVTTIQSLMAIDLVSEKLLWEIRPEGGCDRLAISPDGKVLYVPSLESKHWNVIDAESGKVLQKIVTNSGAHNTIFAPSGTEVYMAGLKSPYLFVASASDHTIVRKVGPFSAPIRPFTVNAAATRCYVNVNELPGFEIGDLQTGKKLARVALDGVKVAPTKRHGCPSHGIALTPDEKEIWVTDAANSKLHIFSNESMPPVEVDSVTLGDQPGWITFTISGDYAYPSTCEVIDSKSRKIIAQLKDESGTPVQSEKLMEIDFADGRPIRAGDQFGIGRRP
jgi:DNA-binding beta-propeller fold protein YncE